MDYTFDYKPLLLSDLKEEGDLMSDFLRCEDISQMVIGTFFYSGKEQKFIHFWFVQYGQLGNRCWLYDKWENGWREERTRFRTTYPFTTVFTEIPEPVYLPSINDTIISFRQKRCKEILNKISPFSRNVDRLILKRLGKI